MILALFGAIPAEAATRYVSVSTRNAAISSNGNGKVYATCHATRTCRGKVYIGGGTEHPVKFSIGAKKSKYIGLTINASQAANPNGPGGTGPLNTKSAKLLVNEDSPKNVTHGYSITVEKLKTRTTITGTVQGAAPLATGVKVGLWRIRRGGGTDQLKTADIGGNPRDYAFSVPLGVNNSASPAYELRISGYDQDGEFRTWWYRGGNNAARGGGKYIGEASRVRASKYGYRADFNYGSIIGTVSRPAGPIGNAQVTVAAPPAYRSTNRLTQRELDVQGCANVLGQTNTASNGSYDIGFLPVSAGGTDKRYMIQAKPAVAVGDSNGPVLPVWNGKYRSCNAAMGYGSSTSRLYALNAAPAVANILAHPIAMSSSTSRIDVNADYAGFKPTALGDRFLRLRERIPGRKILDSPVVANLNGKANGTGTFKNLAAGRYWVEVGRRTSCSTWYPSRYANNTAYLSGLDRGNERWKTVAGKFAEYKYSYTRGYKAKTPPAGFRGWMYRDHCKAFGTGYYKAVDVTGLNDPTDKVNPRIKRGAVIKGHVSRTKGRSNKEMMVTVYSTGGTKVLRTHFTDSRGNFTIQGLPTGTYRIGVNLDSWRGIGRTFTGKHTKSVTAGHRYSVGTLKFKG